MKAGCLTRTRRSARRCWAVALLTGFYGAAGLRAADTFAGLWVGQALAEKVSRPGQAASGGAADEPLPAANPFAFRLLVHVDTNGQARLLQRALTVWNPKGAVVTNSVTGRVTTNGFHVLLADESQAPAYLKDQPQSKVYRVSSVNFPLMAPQPMAGAFGGSGTLSCTVSLPYDDPVNPFVHVYAPLHDNFRVQNGVKTKLPGGEESPSVSRDLSLKFAAQDPANPANPQWGVEEVGGDYTEIVEGLYRPIQVQGRFRLERLTTIGRLEP
jgi:hypothetical protein